MTNPDGSGAQTDVAGESPTERRRHKRVIVNLPGRYMLEDGSERPCNCVDISVGGARLQAPQGGPWGSRVVAYIDGVGRIEGYIVRRSPGWFSIEMHVSTRKGERVQERIAMLTQADDGAASDRRHEAREWSERAVKLYTLDGLAYEATLTDISREGAALLTEAVLEIGQRVRLDSRRGCIARLFPGGAAMKFENWVDEKWPQREAALKDPPPRARKA